MRYKSFVATGIAPDGRLYAGDLNGIQDTFVSLTDFTQTLDVGTLRVGDPSLQLVKYGAGEFRMSGSLRVDGILRGLGGLLAGAFTTTQRDAIPLGSRPYGLIILNTTSNRYEWNAGTDAVPDWNAMGGGMPSNHASRHLPGGSDPLDYTAIHLAGTRAAKPAASAANNGLTYFETDWTAVWRSNGSTWVRMGQRARYCTVTQFAALPDFQDADEVILELSAANGVRWHLRYNSGSASPYKWEYIGGACLWAKDDSTYTVTATSYQVAGPSVVIPRAGEYDVTVQAEAGGIDNQPVQYNHARMSFSGPGITASDARCAIATFVGGYKLSWDITKTERTVFTLDGTVSAAYRGFNADDVDFQSRVVKISPLRIA